VHLSRMVKVGEYNLLKVSRKVEFGVYMDDGGDGILLPKRFVPKNVNIGDVLEVFLYHDSDNRLIATTQKPKGVVGDIVLMKAVAV
ncbi:S1-like domain-containing RNA-binding protein, partial [Klebsiella pneumoniae]|uniref:S1-like domain-containing RNA-binding protein n=1 Tax=Klebsiella pneumoniae TaxID=573 RepID=UPI0038523DC4